MSWSPRPNFASWSAVLRDDPCAYCSGLGGTIDHVYPRSLGGSKDWPNLAGACNSCNSTKGSLPLLYFLLMRKGWPPNVRSIVRHRQAAQVARTVRAAKKTADVWNVPMKGPRLLQSSGVGSRAWKRAYAQSLGW